jgi:hypothetical protein
LAAAKQRRLEGAQAPLLSKDSDDDDKKKVSGAKRMQYGIFRKAAVLNDSDEAKKGQSSDSDGRPAQKKSKAKKVMDVDSEEEEITPKRKP